MRDESLNPVTTKGDEVRVTITGDEGGAKAKGKRQKGKGKREKGKGPQNPRGREVEIPGGREIGRSGDREMD